jgi:acyl-CoA synthetase (AMP-forming)/AMP-acid ligase II
LPAPQSAPDAGLIPGNKSQARVAWLQEFWKLDDRSRRGRRSGFRVGRDRGGGRDLEAGGSSVCEAELIAHCRTFLSSFKVPKKIDFRDQMPMSSFGRILRREVRKFYWEHLEVKV